MAHKQTVLYFKRLLKIIMKKIEELRKKAPQGGFTLIEILIVIGIIAILAAIVLVAVNPAEQFKKANDAQRASNVNAILNAIGQYIVDSKGDLPGGIPSGTAPADADEIGDASGQADICEDLVPEYIAALPADPNETDQSITEDECGTYSIGYTIYENNGRVTIIAPSTEIGSDISVTR